MPAQLRRRVGQPAGRVRVDWGNPLNAGLRFVFDMGRGPFEFLSREAPRTATDTPPSLVQSSDQWRAAYLSAASAENLQWGNNASATSSPLNGILSGATQHTVELLFRPRSSASYHLFSQWNLSSGNHWLVQVNGSGLVWVAAEDGGGNRRRWDGTSLFAANRWHRLILSWQGGGAYTAVLDGVERTLTAVNTAANSVRANPVALRIAPNTGGTPNVDVALARMWSRGLSRDECLQLADQQPFEFYAPRRVYVPLSGPPPAIGSVTAGNTELTFTYSGPATHYRVFPLGDTPGAWVSIPPSPVTESGLVVASEYTIQVSGDGSTVADSRDAGTLNPGGGGVGPGGGATAHSASGALVANGAAIDGTASRIRVHGSSGALSAGGALVDGLAARSRLHGASGALSAGGAAVDGSAARSRLHGASGALLAGGAVVDGAAERIVPGGSHVASGALVGSGAVVDGAAARSRAAVEHAASGALVGAGAVVDGAGRRVVAGLVTITIRLVDAPLSGSPLGGLSNIQWAWWDDANDLSETWGVTPTASGTTESTDGGGTVTLEAVSSKTSGQAVFVQFYQHGMPPRAFSGLLTVD